MKAKLFRIRRMAPSDSPEVIGMLNRHFPHVGMTGEKLEQRLGKGAVFFVAESGGKILGFADLRMGKNALVRGLAVEEKWRGSGVGTALLEKAVEEARKKGYGTVYIKVQPENLEAVRVYQKIGFAAVREMAGKDGKPILLMRKRLEN